VKEHSEQPWHEDPQFWSALRDGIFDEQLWANAASEVEQLLALVPLREGAAVLDLPCGPGRHVVPLASRRFSVCGVDLSASYLEEAGKRAASAGLEVELVLADMRSFVRPASFDLAINLYTSFGYSGNLRDDQRMLQNLFDSLRPGGRLVLELVTRETAVADGPYTHELGNGQRIVEQAALLEDGRIIQRRWQLQGPGVDRSWTAWHRLYTTGELAELLRNAGFIHVEVYGGFDRRPFSKEGGGAVLVASR